MKYRFLIAIFNLASVVALAGEIVPFTTPGSIIAEDFDDEMTRGKWFAVHQVSGDWYLSLTPVTAVGDKGDDSIIDVRAKYKDVVGLLKHKSLVEGKLESAALIKDKLGHSRSFIFREKKYSLLVKPVKFKCRSPELGKTFDNVRNDVYFSDGSSSVLVYGGAETQQSSGDPFVIWAGDIDRDGKPDLIASFDDDSEKNASLCVFLSGGAKNGQFFGKSGCQFFSG